MIKHAVTGLLFLAFLSGCEAVKNPPSDQTKIAATKAQVPLFNSDSAYRYIEQQLQFGPRTPGSNAHAQCAAFLSAKMSSFADTVIVQEFRARAYNSTVLEGKNIISIFNPQAKKRILLGAHWDSRPYADHDPDKANHRKPIDGANDGASGVGVLIEIGRLLQQSPLTSNLGIDIIFFDLEDYGPHNDNRSAEGESFWALGSQHWANNMHRVTSKAQFGILLDMVGATNAVFPREYYSQQYAAWVLDKVWRTASRLGFADVFINKPGLPIMDDHIAVNRVAGIPMINIIHIDQNSSNGTFYEHWHTMNDNLGQIDKKTLQIVGKVVSTVIYEAQ